MTDTFRFPRSAVSGYFLAKLELTSGRAHGKVTYVPLILRALPVASRDDPRAGLCQHLAGLQRLGRQEPLSEQQHEEGSCKSRLLHPSVRHDSAGSHPMGDRTSPLSRARGIRRLVHDRRRHRSKPGASSGAIGSSSPPGTTSTGARECGTPSKQPVTAGRILRFFGADIADWQIRYENHRRTIVEYRDATTDPVTESRPQDGALRATRSAAATVRTPGHKLHTDLRGHNDPPRSYAVNPPRSRTRGSEGLASRRASELPDSVGYAWDTIQPGCAVPPLTVLFRYQGLDGRGNPTSAEVVRYTAPSGARVFSSGSLLVRLGA